MCLQCQFFRVKWTSDKTMSMNIGQHIFIRWNLTSLHIFSCIRSIHSVCYWHQQAQSVCVCVYFAEKCAFDRVMRRQYTNVSKAWTWSTWCHCCSLCVAVLSLLSFHLRWIVLIAFFFDISFTRCAVSSIKSNKKWKRNNNTRALGKWSREMRMGRWAVADRTCDEEFGTNKRKHGQEKYPYYSWQGTWERVRALVGVCVVPFSHIIEIRKRR